MDQVEEEVYEVINHYRSRKFLNEIAYSEYQELIECIKFKLSLIFRFILRSKINN